METSSLPDFTAEAAEDEALAVPAAPATLSKEPSHVRRWVLSLPSPSATELELFASQRPGRHLSEKIAASRFSGGSAGPRGGIEGEGWMNEGTKTRRIPPFGPSSLAFRREPRESPVVVDRLALSGFHRFLKGRETIWSAWS